MDKKFWYAVSILVGTIVGVGMFALPYTFYKAGFFVGLLYLFFLFFILLYMHFMMGEVVLRTNERHRFVGYVGIYLGKKFRSLSAVTSIAGVLGGLFAYILASGFFIKALTGGAFSNINFNQFLFWAVMSLIFLFGVSALRRSELVLSALLIIITAVIFIFGFSDINSVNFFTFDSGNFFLPYGSVMYALVGLSAVPLMRDSLLGEERQFKKAIFFGMAFSAVIYILFSSLVVGISGSSVSEDALSGLIGILGYKIIFLGAVLGLLAVATSYISFATYLKQTLTLDLGVKSRSATLFVLFLPILSVVSLPVGFMSAITFLGAVFVGIDGIFLILIYLASKKTGDRAPEYSLKIPKTAIFLMAVVFLAGMLYEIFYTLK